MVSWRWNHTHNQRGKDEGESEARPRARVRGREQVSKAEGYGECKSEGKSDFSSTKYEKIILNAHAGVSKLDDGMLV